MSDADGVIGVMETDGLGDHREGPGISAVQEKSFHEVLTNLLATRTEQEILDCQDKFDDTRRAQYRWDVWAAA